MVQPAPKIALIAITKHGALQAKSLAKKLAGSEVVVAAKFADLMAELSNNVRAYTGPLRDEIARLFAAYEQLVFFVSLGAVVRLIAPHLKSKDVDPGVIVIDDAGQFVIPLLSGHVGGANASAENIAELIQATAVVTTASDVGKTIAVDILGRELGWVVEAPKINITRVSAHVVNQEPVALVQEVGAKNWWTRATPLPANIHLFDRFEAVNPAHYKAILWITDRAISEQTWEQFSEKLVVYRPPSTQP